MAVVDSDSRKLLASPAIGEGCDAVAFDASRGLAFASAAEGMITVINEDAGDRYSVTQTVTTRKSARTMAVDTRLLSGHRGNGLQIQVWSKFSSYLGKFICPIRSRKRGLERRSSKRASTLSNKSHSACCWYEVSSH
jgi:hypothetical protein